MRTIRSKPYKLENNLYEKKINNSYVIRYFIMKINNIDFNGKICNIFIASFFRKNNKKKKYQTRYARGVCDKTRNFFVKVNSRFMVVNLCGLCLF